MMRRMAVWMALAVGLVACREPAPQIRAMGTETVAAPVGSEGPNSAVSPRSRRPPDTSLKEATPIAIVPEAVRLDAARIQVGARHSIETTVDGLARASQGIERLYERIATDLNRGEPLIFVSYIGLSK